MYGTTTSTKTKLNKNVNLSSDRVSVAMTTAAEPSFETIIATASMIDAG